MRLRPFAQIWGRKRLVLFAPHDAEHLYTHAANPVLLASRFNPDAPDYEAMPRARKAQAIECMVEPGDLLYLPAGWFHQVQALALSLSANLWAHDTPLALTSQD
ncbi:MAG: cupin-like domain-containing protein [Polaromonas sp.]